MKSSSSSSSIVSRNTKAKIIELKKKKGEFGISHVNFCIPTHLITWKFSQWNANVILFSIFCFLAFSLNFPFKKREGNQTDENFTLTSISRSRRSFTVQPAPRRSTAPHPNNANIFKFGISPGIAAIVIDLVLKDTKCIYTYFSYSLDSKLQIVVKGSSKHHEKRKNGSHINLYSYWFWVTNGQEKSRVVNSIIFPQSSLFTS